MYVQTPPLQGYTETDCQQLIKTIQKRERSSFLDPQWRYTGEVDTFSAIEHKLYDLAFQMTATLGEYERAVVKSDPPYETLLRCVREYEDSASGFAELLQALKDLRPPDTVISSGDFWDLQSAVLAAYILVIYKRACDHTHSGIKELLKNPNIADSERWQLGSMVSGTVSIHSVLHLCRLRPALLLRVRSSQTLVEYALYSSKYIVLTERIQVPKFSGRRINELSARVTAAGEYGTKDEMGLYGCQKMLFPIRLLWVTIAKDAPYFDRVERLWQRISDSSGIGHAKDLEKLWGKKGETGKDLEQVFGVKGAGPRLPSPS